MRRIVLVAIFGVLAAPAGAATPGFVEDFTAGSAGFGGGSTVTHVTSGGVGGAADPYISISNSTANNLGSFSTDADLVGNLPADGVTGYTFWLRDTGAQDALEIHVGIGTMSNFWLSFFGFTPTNSSWQQFLVDVTNPSQWVQTAVPAVSAAGRAALGVLLCAVVALGLYRRSGTRRTPSP